MIKAVSSGGSWGKFSNEFFCKKKFYVVILTSKKNFYKKIQIKNSKNFQRLGLEKLLTNGSWEALVSIW